MSNDIAITPALSRPPVVQRLAMVNILPSQWMLTTTLHRFDDLIPEESETVQKAIKRLPAKEAYDRVFRIRRAFQVRPIPPSLAEEYNLTNHPQSQCSISHTLLPANEQIKPEEVSLSRSCFHPNFLLPACIHSLANPVARICHISPDYEHPPSPIFRLIRY